MPPIHMTTQEANAYNHYKYALLGTLHINLNQCMDRHSLNVKAFNDGRTSLEEYEETTKRIEAEVSALEELYLQIKELS